MDAFRGWAGISIALALLMFPLLCQAEISGNCSNCHTMHNSEQGKAVAFNITQFQSSRWGKLFTETPMPNLLKTDCVGCHSSAGAETIVGLVDISVPIVLNFSEPTYPPDGSTTSALAGGNFHWMLTRGDPYGHNVEGISEVDQRFLPNMPPGSTAKPPGCINCHYTLATPQSGCEGCHVPFHHENSSDVSVVGQAEGWYRFLGSVMQRHDQKGPPPEGVVGIEAPDWEQNPLASQHNVYQGKPGPYVNYLESGAIDQKCVGCHGRFHSETIVGSTWIRHPADVAIPNAGEFTGFTTYDPLVPVARQNVSLADANFSSINRGSDVVSCLSCHRPHGSPYPAMLRWGFRDWPGTDSHTQQPAYNGCAVCHTAKG